jgi:hypothetical protein
MINTGLITKERGEEDRLLIAYLLPLFLLLIRQVTQLGWSYA